MWRNGKDLKMSQPLMPRPICISSTTNCKHNSICAIPSSCACCVQNPNFRSWNHPLISEVHTMPLVSSRWNPTPEQLWALEEMFQRGIRTPSSEQIQQIAAKLRKFGKIEGKNVFYWFQNHKARDRQKKRRQLEELATEGKKMRHAQSFETKSTGLSMRYYETEHPNKLATPSNYSTPSEASVSVIAECRKDEWTQLNQKELQQITTKVKNEACWKLDLSSCMYPSNSTVQTVNAQRFKGQENADPFGALDHSRVLSLKNDEFRIFERDGIEENQTLQLFPVKRNDHLSNLSVSRLEEILHDDVSIGGAKFAPNKFIEFLPTKK